MRIAFADFSDWDYKVESVYERPMGGSQSAICYLAEALANQGHKVFLLNNTSASGMSCGVMCLSWKSVSEQLLQSLDALIVLNSVKAGIHLRPSLGKQTRLILFIQFHWIRDHENPFDIHGLYDGLALVSNWQRNKFQDDFGIEHSRTCVLRNAIAPVFSGLFSDNVPILAHKSKPPILAYTSTPFRGLDVLLEVFPSIRQALPGTRLKVFSSMKVYQASETEDESDYGWLYRKCRQTEGVEYIGSLPQPNLARELQSVMVLAYPNTFQETSCIAVMEAMASGCWIVTSDLGALPETTAGFARLVPIEGKAALEAYKERFVAETVQILKSCTAPDNTTAETHLRQQVTYVNRMYTWSVRAQEWVEWLSSICAKPAEVPPAMPLNWAATSAQVLKQAYHYLIQGQYPQAISLYEQVIQSCPTVMLNYWYLGLAFLLQGEELQAQTTWSLAMMNGVPEEIDMWIAELVQVLQAEAARQESLKNYQTVELIQKYIERQ